MIRKDNNKNLRDGAFGLSCGLVQNLFILFKSEFLVSLRNGGACLSHNLKQLPAARRRLWKLPRAAYSAKPHSTSGEVVAGKDSMSPRAVKGKT